MTIMAGRELTIGGLARRTGVKVPTIRYYEQVGLLPHPERSPGNQRLYSPRHLKRLTFIRHCREFGFPQAAVRELLALADRPGQSCQMISRIAAARLAEIEQRMARMGELKSELARMIAACAGGAVRDCRIVEALADDSGDNGPGGRLAP
jgi:DNA-binding transcriptional MerR regulator